MRTDNHLHDTDAPTLPAYDMTDSMGRVLWGVWCCRCEAWHWHGAQPGHRIAHCRVPGSPYEASGYNIEHAGAWYAWR